MPYAVLAETPLLYLLMRQKQGDRLECRIELRAQTLHCRTDNDDDQTCDQTIFQRCYAPVISQEACGELFHCYPRFSIYSSFCVPRVAVSSCTHCTVGLSFGARCYRAASERCGRPQ